MGRSCDDRYKSHFFHILPTFLQFSLSWVGTLRYIGGFYMTVYSSKPLHKRALFAPSTLALMLAGCGGSSGSRTIVPANVAPVVDGDVTLSVAEDSALAPFAVSAPSDGNGDALTVTIDDLPTDGTVFLSSDPDTALTLDTALTASQIAQLSFQPDFGFDGDAGAFAYTVSDLRGGTASQTVRFDVENIFSDAIANALIDGATVFLDTDGDGVLDVGEPSTMTDENGRYTLLEGTGVLISQGGIDGLTGLRLDFETFMTAQGGTVASPLNTLLFYADDGDDVLIKTKLQGAIDDAGGVDVGTYDASARSVLGGGNLASEVMQLNQEINIVVTILRTLYQLTDEPDPQAAAYRALAANLEQTLEEDEIGLTLSLDFSADVVREIAQDLTGVPDFISSTLDGIVDFVSGEILSFTDFGLDLLEIDPLGFFSPLRRAVAEKYTVDAVDLLKNLRDPSAFGAILEGLFDIREQLTIGLDDILLRQITFGDNIQFSPR